MPRRPSESVQSGRGESRRRARSDAGRFGSITGGWGVREKRPMRPRYCRSREKTRNGRLPEGNRPSAAALLRADAHGVSGCHVADGLDELRTEVGVDRGPVPHEAVLDHGHREGLVLADEGLEEALLRLLAEHFAVEDAGLDVVAVIR